MVMVYGLWVILAVALALEKVVRCCLKGWKKLYLCGLNTGKKLQYESAP